MGFRKWWRETVREIDEDGWPLNDFSYPYSYHGDPFATHYESRRPLGMQTYDIGSDGQLYPQEYPEPLFDDDLDY